MNALHQEGTSLVVVVFGGLAVIMDCLSLHHFSCFSLIDWHKLISAQLLVSTAHNILVFNRVSQRGLSEGAKTASLFLCCVTIGVGLSGGTYLQGSPLVHILLHKLSLTRVAWHFFLCDFGHAL